MVQNPPWTGKTVPAPTRTAEMASHHVHEPEKSPRNARTRHRHLPRNKTRGYNPIATKKCVTPTPSVRKRATLVTRAHVRATHTDVGYSSKTAQPVYNDLTVWRLNQVALVFLYTNKQLPTYLRIPYLTVRTAGEGCAQWHLLCG